MAALEPRFERAWTQLEACASARFTLRRRAETAEIAEMTYRATLKESKTKEMRKVENG